MLKIGAYKVGNNPITRFENSKNIEKLCQIASKDLGFDTSKNISREQVVNLLNKFGKVGKRAMNEMPADENRFYYFAGHDTLQIHSLKDKPIISIVERLRNPITEMIKSIPHRIISILK